MERHFAVCAENPQKWRQCLFRGQKGYFSQDKSDSDMKYLQSTQQPINPNAVNLFLFRMDFQATDRWLLIHTCKFIYDWKSVHITHFKNIIRVHMRFMVFSYSFLIIVIDFFPNTTANVYWVLITCQALFKNVTCIVISSYQSSNVDGDYVITIILPVGKPRNREVTKVAQGCTGNKWKSSLFVLNHNASDSLSVSWGCARVCWQAI